MNRCVECKYLIYQGIDNYNKDCYFCINNKVKLIDAMLRRPDEAACEYFLAKSKIKNIIGK